MSIEKFINYLDEDDSIIIGEFDLNDYIENIAEEGNIIDFKNNPKHQFKKLSSLIIEVRGPKDGGNHPHLHAYGTQIKKMGGSNGIFSTAVCLNQNKYFLHSDSMDKFKDNILKLFDKLMGSKYKNEGISVWEKCVEEWNKCERSTYVTITKKPDYSTMTKSV